MNNLYLLLFAIVSYLVGSLNWALIISISKNKDIRKMGSGNPGTLNMSRNFGLKFGLLTFFLDILKGVIPALLSYFVFGDKKFNGTEFYIYDFSIYTCGLFCVLGHIYPVYYKFKGGKGIATTIGVFALCESVHGVWVVVVIMALVAAGLFIYFTEFGAMGSFIAITLPAVAGSIRLFLTYCEYSGRTTTFYIITNMLIFAICFFTWFAHRGNIERMLSGDEHPTSIKRMVISAKAKKLEESKGNESERDK